MLNSRFSRISVNAQNADVLNNRKFLLVGVFSFVFAQVVGNCSKNVGESFCRPYSISSASSRPLNLKKNVKMHRFWQILLFSILEVPEKQLTKGVTRFFSKVVSMRPIWPMRQQMIAGFEMWTLHPAPSLSHHLRCENCA